jgi:hypothetical protein
MPNNLPKAKYLSVVAALCLTSAVFAHSGHTDWGPWRFDWEVKDNAGIALRNVYFGDELVFYKASVPVIRVRYQDDVCGPYADQINWSYLLNISNCGNQKVCQTSFVSAGRTWLEISVLAQIGKYQIYQVWYLSADGHIQPTVWSKGLHCDYDHDHHAYWRLDLDIRDAAGDQVFVRNDGAPDVGWGPGWQKYASELNTVKHPPKNRVWFVRDNATGHGLWILPGPDGTADGFSNKDVAPRRYRSAEDEPWPFGAWGHLGYGNSEGVQEQDIVYWYVAHLHHEEEHGEDQWHWIGPRLIVHR